ncbi:MAG TPA: hypothetical protein VF592_01965 [Sphingomonas sp.]|jgi:uncharacterized C2H2 Zn-finger protein|uniref:hypothetical protein n=1 Tax=Sphingomonas sp. TaxID=28214 RepID=UPI002ED859F8
MVKRLNKAAEVKVSDGDVVVKCPEGEDAVFTPEAALQTAQRLGDKAVEAIIDRGRVDAAKPTAEEEST